jgi:hypothetical protein
MAIQYATSIYGADQLVCMASRDRIVDATLAVSNHERWKKVIRSAGIKAE